MSAEQVPYGVDEFDRAGLEKEYARTKAVLGVPMVKASPVKFECVYHSTLRLPGNPPMGTVDIIIGRVVAVHIANEVLTDGILDVRKTQPIARCGYYQYAVVRETFEMVIPGLDEAVLYGLEGSAKKNREVAETSEMEVLRRPSIRPRPIRRRTGICWRMAERRRPTCRRKYSRLCSPTVLRF